MMTIIGLQRIIGQWKKKLLFIVIIRCTYTLKFVRVNTIRRHFYSTILIITLKQTRFFNEELFAASIGKLDREIIFGGERE